MLDKKLLNNFAVIAASYAKRWMESCVYDRLFKTKYGEKIKRLDKKAAYGIEFGLNFLTSVLDQKISEDTALKKFIKEVGMDAASELSKRLLNGLKIDSSDTTVYKE